MIELEAATDRLVRHTLVSLVRKVPWGPSRDALIKESERFLAESKAATLKVNDIVLKELFTHNARGDEDDAVLEEKRERERRFLSISAESGWKHELYALAASARFPRLDDFTVERFADSVVEDIRNFQQNGFTSKSPAMRDVSEAVSSYLESEGLDLSDIVLPPTIYDLIDSGAERPAHVDQDLWDREVEAYYRQMTLDNTPTEFINGGYDDSDGYGWGGSRYDYANDEDEQEEAEAPAMR